MDMDNPPVSGSGTGLAGFRKRWSSKRSSDEVVPEPLSFSSPVEVPPDSASLFGETDVEFADFTDLGETTGVVWKPFESQDDLFGVEFPDELEAAESTKRVFEDVDEYVNQGPQVLDPKRLEPNWRAVAMQTELKRVKSCYDKLPWEMDGSAFRPEDKWHGTILAGFDKHFMSTCVGASDVWDSQIVSARPCTSASSSDVPVVPLQLKRARGNRLMKTYADP
eukprot:s3525_g1.t1